MCRGDWLPARDRATGCAGITSKAMPHARAKSLHQPIPAGYTAQTVLARQTSNHAAYRMTAQINPALRPRFTVLPIG